MEGLGPDRQFNRGRKGYGSTGDVRRRRQENGGADPAGFATMRMRRVVLALTGFVRRGDAKRRQRPVRKHILAEFSRIKFASRCGGQLMGEADEH